MLSLGQPLLGQADLSAVRMAWQIWDKCATGGPDRHGVDLNQGALESSLRDICIYSIATEMNKDLYTYIYIYRFKLLCC